MSTSGFAIWKVSDRACPIIDQQVQNLLKENIRFLGDLLGDTIRRLSGEVAYQLVEDDSICGQRTPFRTLGAAARKLRERLDQLDLSELRTLIRAFSIFFDL